jgi:hypothetical protein
MPTRKYSILLIPGFVIKHEEAWQNAGDGKIILRITARLLPVAFATAVFYCVCVEMYSIVNWQAVLQSSHVASLRIHNDVEWQAEEPQSSMG